MWIIYYIHMRLINSYNTQIWVKITYERSNSKNEMKGYGMLYTFQ